VNSNRNVVHSEMLSATQRKFYLSGMPGIMTQPNDKVVFETTCHSMFTVAPTQVHGNGRHQSVPLSRFESDCTISFILLDGKFDLMPY
ncbi:hypothetical protein F5141DRAFT_995337, partial [Pisolithus sp. B1]